MTKDKSYIFKTKGVFIQKFITRYVFIYVIAYSFGDGIFELSYYIIEFIQFYQ